jgi:LPXTG-motif cell wall-anchored protein
MTVLLTAFAMLCFVIGGCDIHYGYQTPGVLAIFAGVALIALLIIFLSMRRRRAHK